MWRKLHDELSSAATSSAGVDLLFVAAAADDIKGMRDLAKSLKDMVLTQQHGHWKARALAEPAPQPAEAAPAET